jgi:hypothetical protein
MDFKTTQLLMDDIGVLVEMYGLPLGEMMNQSPRNVLLNCIRQAKIDREALSLIRLKVAVSPEEAVYLFTQDDMVRLAACALTGEGELEEIYDAALVHRVRSEQVTNPR